MKLAGVLLSALFVLGLLGHRWGGASLAGAEEEDPFRVGAFNVRMFGQKKVEDKAAVDIIARIIVRYDIILLQEIRDKEETAIDILLDEVNKVSSDDPYSMIISERLGRSYSKEQYAYLYRSSKATLLYKYTYKDPGDRFEREPYIAIFQSSYTAVSPFGIIGIHTRPSDAWEELNLLPEVEADVHEKVRAELEIDLEDIMFTGDFNGDCSYVPNYRWEQVALRTNSRYKWLIEDDVDTTVAKSDCTYDRFVITGKNMESAVLPCSATVFRFDTEFQLSYDQTWNVSDHYPVEVTLLPPKFKYSPLSALSIAAFNIQIFGEKKASKDDVMDYLARIVKRYDLILVQEIRDSREGEPAVKELQDLANRGNEDKFEYVISERLGRSSSKEQYAYFYRPSKLQLLSSWVFDERNGDVFQREPFMAHFKSLTTTYVEEFVIGGIHTQPDEAVPEIDHLVDVYDAIQERLNIKNVIFTGDFNADCSYVSKRRWADIRLKNDPRFCWLINNDLDTTVKGTDCAYDRFVVAGDEMKEAIVPYSATVFRFDTAYGLDEEQAALVSDHYPIELHLRSILSDENESRRTEILRRLIDLLEFSSRP